MVAKTPARLNVIFLAKNKYESIEALCKLLSISAHLNVLCVCVSGAVPASDQGAVPHEGCDLRRAASELGLVVCIHRQIYEALERSQKRNDGTWSMEECERQWLEGANKKTGERGPLFLDNVDYTLSYLFAYKLKNPLIECCQRACVNFHPGPLPQARGCGGYNFAILYEAESYGVTAHHVSEEFDEGDILEEVSFPIARSSEGKISETALSLERKTSLHLLRLFQTFLQRYLVPESLAEGRLRPLPRKTQVKTGEGWGGIDYVTREDFNYARAIACENEIKRPDVPRSVGSTLHTPEAKICELKGRAFWYPPYPGAQIMINGKAFTLVPNEILENVGALFWEKENSRLQRNVNLLLSDLDFISSDNSRRSLLRGCLPAEVGGDLLPILAKMIHPAWRSLVTSNSPHPSFAKGSVQRGPCGAIHIIKTASRYFRSGEFHAVSGFGIVIEGSVKISRVDLSTAPQDGEAGRVARSTTYSVGDRYYLPSAEAVLFEYLADTVETIIWDSAEVPTGYYTPFREAVISHNSRMNGMVNQGGAIFPHAGREQAESREVAPTKPGYCSAEKTAH